MSQPASNSERRFGVDKDRIQATGPRRGGDTVDMLRIEAARVHLMVHAYTSACVRRAKLLMCSWHKGLLLSLYITGSATMGSRDQQCIVISKKNGRHAGTGHEQRLDSGTAVQSGASPMDTDTLDATCHFFLRHMAYAGRGWGGLEEETQITVCRAGLIG